MQINRYYHYIFYSCQIPCPAEKANFLSKLTFWWFTRYAFTFHYVHCFIFPKLSLFVDYSSGAEYTLPSNSSIFLKRKVVGWLPIQFLTRRAGLNLRGCVSPRFARFSGETRISSRRLVFKDSFHLVL